MPYILTQQKEKFMIGYLALIIGWIAHVLTLKGKQLPSIYCQITS